MGQTTGNPYLPRGERDATVTSRDDNQPVRPVQSRAQTVNPYLPGAAVEMDPLRRALRQGVEQPQTRAQRVEQLRIQLGIPAALIEANFDELDKRARAGQVHPDDLRRIAPSLARWLGQDGTKAAAVAPDLQKLAGLEQQLTFSGAILRGWNQNVQGSLYGTLETLGALSGNVSAYQYGKEGRERNRLEALTYGQIDYAHVFDSPGNIATFVTQLVGEQVPIMGAQLGARGAGAVAGAPLGAPGVAIGSWTGAFAMSLGLGIGEMQSLLHELDPEGHHPVAALIGGTGIAALDTITGGFLGTFGSRALRGLARATGVARPTSGLGSALLRRFGPVAGERMARQILVTPVEPRFLTRTAAGTVTAMSSEALTEAAQKVVADYTAYTATGLEMPWGQTFTEALFEGLAGGIVGGVYGLPGEALGSLGARRAAMRADQQRAFFQALGNGVKDIDSLGKLPASMAEFVAGVSGDQGLTDWYVPTQTFEEYWQRQGVSPALVAEELTGDRTALDTAKREGTDLAIPTQAYAVKIAPTEHHAFFVNELKLDPQAANTREVTEDVARAAARATQAPAADTTAETQRRTIAGLVEERAVARNTPRFMARVLGQVYARRYVERGAILGVDPVELFQAQGEQIAVEFPAGAGARSLLPLVEAGTETEAALPASVALGKETAEQRDRRRTTHLAALTSAVLREAQRTDPLVDPDLIAREVETRVQVAEEQQALQREQGRGQALLRAVAGYGGLWAASGARWADEVQQMAREARDRRTRQDRGRPTTWNQVRGVFAEETGLPPDVLLQRLQQTGEFADIASDDDLIAAIEEALRARPDVDAIPGTAEMRRLGVVPGERWWEDAWSALPAEEVSDSVETGEGEVTFDPDEFLQRTLNNLHLAPAAIVRGFLRLSTRIPWGEGATEATRPLVTNLAVVLKAGDEVIGRFATAIGKWGLVPKAQVPSDPRAALDASVTAMVDNLRWLWNLWDSMPDVRERARLWYVGAHRIARALAGQYGLTIEQAAGILAALSPQKDWFENVHQAERVLAILFDNAATNAEFTPAMFDGFRRALRKSEKKAKDPAKARRRNSARIAEHRAFVGQRWFQLPEATQAVMLRWQDELATDGSYRMVLPEGGRGPVMVTKAGKPQKHRWQTYEAIAKTIRIARAENAQVETIHALLGTEHKVRSFFNNIVDPRTATSVTIDTHAVGAVLLKSVTSDSPEVQATLGGTPGAADEGLSGLNAVVAEAYARLAAEMTERLGAPVLPREVQSVTWEAIRLLFPRELKSTTTRGADVDTLWEAFTRGTLSADAVRAGILDRTGPLGRPAWADVREELPADQSGVAVGGERGGTPGLPARPGAGVADSTRTGGTSAADLGRVPPVTGRDPRTARAAKAQVTRLADLTRRAVAGEEFYQSPREASGVSAARGFHSRLDRAVQAAKVDVATGRDWKAIIRGSKAGINQDEYRYVGVDSLDDGRRYTRDEVLGFLFEHQVQIEPVELTAREALFTPGELEAETERIYTEALARSIEIDEEAGLAPTLLTEEDVSVVEDEQFEGMFEATAEGRWLGTFESEAAAQRAGAEFIAEQNSLRRAEFEDTAATNVSWDQAQDEAERNLLDRHADREAHFSTYTQPGAVAGSYRELFFTAPNHGTADIHAQQLKQLDRVLDHWRRMAEPLPPGEPLPLLGVPVEDSARLVTILEDLRGFPGHLTPDRMGDFGMLNRQDNDFLQAMIPGFWQTMRPDALPPTWQDGHPDYDTITNPIVRVRYNVRTRSAASVQLPFEVRPPVDEERRGEWRVVVTIPGRGEQSVQVFGSEAEAERFVTHNRAMQYTPTESVLFLEEVQPPQTDEFAKMPALFQKQWREMAMRWALQHAANQGYDRVAWTTGEMQLKRWPGLRQHVETIHWYAESQTLVALDRDGTRVVTKEGISNRDLGRYIGEENARRLLAADPILIQPPPAERSPGWERVGTSTEVFSGQRYTLQGQSMAIGGTGLAALYDEDLPRVVSSLPVMRRTKTKASTFALPDLQDVTRYRGPEVTRDQLRADARESISDPSHPMSVAVGRQAGVVAEEMQRGLSFAQAMVNHGSIALANYYGGTLTTAREPATVPGVVLTPALREALAAGQEVFQPMRGDEGGLPRGGYNRLTRVLRGFAGRMDLSTLLHETGHAFVSQLMEDAQALLARDPSTLGPRQTQAVADAHAVLRWFQFDGTVADWLALSRDQQEAMHEQWARGFEAYLMTGKAPVPELQTLFQVMRQWLLEAYKLLLVIVDEQRANQVLQVDLTDEVRQVMDRLFASDAAIAAARESAVEPLFTDQAQAGVDALTWAKYLEDVRQGHARAREALDARLLQEWRRTQQAQWQGEREKVKADVEREAEQSPVYIAQAVIRTGKLPDGSLPYSNPGGQPMKLSKTAIVQMKGTDFLRRLPRPYLYTVQGGLHPDVVAELVGFTSGDALLDALMEAKPYRQVVDAEADLRMRDTHGDMLLDGIELQALAEAHLQEHRSEVIAAELQALTKGMARAALPSAAELRAAAEQRIARTRVVDLRPGLFLAAAKRASQRAFDAFGKNDRVAAVAAKQDEQTSLALYQAAVRAKERSEKTAALLREYQTSRGRRKGLLAAGEDYLDQVDALLERFEFTRTTQRAQGRRAALAAWIEAQRQQGIAVDGIPQWVIEDSRVINWTQLTTESLEGVRQSVEHLAHLARLKNKLLDAREQKALDAIRTEIATAIRDTHPERDPVFEPRRKGERLKKWSAGVLWSHRKIASIARQLDGFVDGGLVWQYGIRPLNEAALREGAQMGAALDALETLFTRHYTANERANLKRKQARPELNSPKHPQVSASKEALLLMALNQGNDTNRQRLRDGYGWSQEQVQQALDAYLDKRDWDFVQAVWDYYDTYWAEIVAKQQRVAGFAPEKVEATPVFTRFGEYRGGYHPIKWEGETSSKNFDLEQDSLADIQKAAAYVHSTTARGHLERRVEGDVINRPVRLDFGVITDHVAQVIHDLTHHEALLDVSRVLGSDEVRSAISETLGIGAWEQWRTALRDIAVGDIPARQEGEGILGWLNNGVSIVGLGLNVMSAAVQWAGLTQSIPRVGAKWIGQGISSYLRGAVAMDGTVTGIIEESAFMRQRVDNQSPEMADARRRLGLDTGRVTGWLGEQLSKVSAGRYERVALADSYFWMITRVQYYAVDVPTYLGARAKAAADPRNRRADGTLDEATIVALAEQAVIDSQGSGDIKDRAAIQRGGPAWQVWVKFYGFFNVTYNQWAEAQRRAGARLRVNPRNPAAVGRLAADFFLLLTLPTVLTHATRSLLQGTAGDELDDPEELVWTLVREHIAFMANLLVLVREFGGAIEGLARYEGPAGARGFASVGKLVTQVGQMEVDEALLRSLNQAAGVVFHYPAGTVDKVFRGIKALIDGETDNPLAPLVGPPPRRE